MKNYIGIEGTDNKHLTVLFLGRQVPRVTIMPIISKYRGYKSNGIRTGIEMWNGTLVATIKPPEHVIHFRNDLLKSGLVKDSSNFEWNPHITLETIDENGEPIEVEIPNKFYLGEPYISIEGTRIYS